MSLMMLLGLKLLHDLLIIESRMHEAWLSLFVRIILDKTIITMCEDDITKDDRTAAVSEVSLTAPSVTVLQFPELTVDSEYQSCSNVGSSTPVLVLASWSKLPYYRHTNTDHTQHCQFCQKMDNKDCHL